MILLTLFVCFFVISNVVPNWSKKSIVELVIIILLLNILSIGNLFYYQYLINLRFVQNVMILQKLRPMYVFQKYFPKIFDDG